jgi:hydrogenase maturation protease
MKSAAAETLVVGYGNDLRGDYALGPRVAAAVAARQIRGVRVLAPRQLLPELAADLMAARRVVFVDASGDPELEGVRTARVGPSSNEAPLGHASRPGDLLALAQAVYGRCPQAWLVTVPAKRFEPGAPLSESAEEALAGAVECVCALCSARFA